MSNFVITFDSRPVDTLLKTMPAVANSSFNKAYASLVKDLAREYSNNQLSTKGIYKISNKPPRYADSKRRPQKRKKGQIAIAKKAQLAGFKGLVTGKKKLQGKGMVLRTGNPLLIRKEFQSEPIRPKKPSGWLMVGFAKRGRGGGLTYRRVKEVVTVANFKGRETWAQKGPGFINKRVRQALKDTKQRTEAKARKAAKKKLTGAAASGGFRLAS